MKLPIYMDYHATTPVDPRVLDLMLPYFTREYGNASSSDHPYGATAREAVEEARGHVANLIKGRPEEIVFTSGATESDNLAIIGLAMAMKQKGNHIITCTTEHRAVLDTCRYLEELGWSVTYLDVDKFGVISLDELRQAITKETVLISIMFANNEIGTISPVSEIGKIARENGILFHTDAAQAAGHVVIDVNAMNIDLMSMSAHKVNGPKGVGALYIRRQSPRVKPTPIIHGGGHEKNLRSGTLNVPGIVGIGAALEIAEKEMVAEEHRFSSWTNKMKSIFEFEIGDCAENGHPEKKLPHNLNMYFKGVESKALVQSLQTEVAISGGSACTSDQVEPSHVITALGHPAARAHSSVRFGVGRFNTDEEIDHVTQSVITSTHRLRSIGTI